MATIKETFGYGAFAQLATKPLYHPLDTWRTLDHTTSTPSPVRSMIAKEGLSSLYKGIAWSIPTVCLKSGTRWSVIKMVDSLFPDNNNLFFRRIGTAVLSAGITTAVFTPFEERKVNSMTRGTNTNKELFRASSYWRGWQPLFLKHAIGTSIYLSIFGAYRDVAKKHYGELSLFQLTAVGSFTGMTNGITIKPIIYVKDCMQQSDSKLPREFKKAFMQTVQEVGLKGMYKKGLFAQVLLSVIYGGGTTAIMETCGAMPPSMSR